MTEIAPEIYDKFGRKHDYLRISLTDRCNLRCFYCMPEEGVALREKSEFMTSEEIIDIAKTFVKMGVKKIRLTGGEPLIKKDAENIIRQLGELPIELTITTNAVLVDKFIDIFKEAGIKSVNVSLDSLDENSFNEISRRGFYNRIKTNIDLLIQNDFHVKVNVVVMRDLNEHEIPDFIKWTENNNVHVRFIEFMPFDGNKWEWEKKVSYKEIMSIVDEAFGADGTEKLADKENDTARSYRLKEGKGTFGIISSVTNPFCDTCNRIRLTADGKIMNCLFSQDESDLLSLYRKDINIEPYIRKAIMSKHEARGGHEFDEDYGKGKKVRAMVSIGG